MDFSSPSPSELDSSSSPESLSYRVPSYLLGADNHTIGKNGGASWFEPSTWGDVAGNITDFVKVSTLSGLNSFYNTGAAVGRFLGADAPNNDTGTWITSLDNDLGQYYLKHEQGADLAGFIATSIIPGIAGIKLFNAGQKALTVARDTGLLGANLSKATGLLIPKTELYIANSAREITQGMNMFSTINASAAKALAAGVQQNVLEGIAFETAIQATMFKSPILDNQDGFDIVKNIALGGAFQGVIGGAFTGAVTYGTIKKSVLKEQGLLARAFNRLVEPMEVGTPASAKVILLQNELDQMAMPLRKLVTGTPETISADAARLNITAAEVTYKDNIRRIHNEQRTAINEMTLDSSGPAEIGNQVADALYGTTREDTLQTLLHVDQIARINELTKIERQILEARARQAQPPAGLGNRYVKLVGEDSGAVLDEYPAVHSLADRAVTHTGQSIKDSVLSTVRAAKHKIDDGFSILNLGKNGAEKAHLQAESRYIWASRSSGLLKGLPGEPFSIHFTDLPVLQRILEDGRLLGVQLVDDANGVLKKGFASTKELQDYIIATKDEVAATLMKSAAKKAMRSGVDPTLQDSQVIAKLVDARVGWIEGTAVDTTNNLRNAFATQTASEDYTAAMKAKGLLNAHADPIDTRFIPTYAKLSYKVPADIDLSGHILNGLSFLKGQQILLKQQAEFVVAKGTGEFYAILPDITQDHLFDVTSTGEAGAGIFSFANAKVGTTGAAAQLSGTVADNLAKSFQKTTGETLESVLAPLARNPEAAIEYSTMTQFITRSAKLWVRDTDNLLGLGGKAVLTDGRGALVERSAYREIQNIIEKAAAEGRVIRAEDLLDHLTETDSLYIFKHLETMETVDAELALSGKRTNNWAEINAVRGQTTNKDPLVFRPLRPNLTDFPHFAFVKDGKVTGSGHTTMLHATSPEKLDELINAVRAKSPQYEIITKGMSDDWFKARGEYDYARSLNENYLNAELANKGIFSEFYTRTDPQTIANNIFQTHLREDKILATEYVRLKNEAAFNWLEDKGKQFSDISGSTFSGSSLSRLEREGKNPYLDYAKTALNVSKVSEYPLLYNFNRQLDSAVSKAVAKVRDVFATAKTPAELEAINTTLDTVGSNTAYANSAELLLANHTAPRGELTRFIRRANSVLATLTLGLDPLNALNNAIGANILRMTELTQQLDAIAKGNPEIAGKLSQLYKVKVPGTGGDEILSATKLVQRGIKFFANEPIDSEQMQYFKTLGVLKGPIEQFRSILDDFTLQGTESVSNLEGRIASAFQKAKTFRDVGSKYSGNDLAEEYNRVVSAYSMMQITDLAQKAGIMDAREAGVYINTFVNRVEGNITASQRPLIFQGPIGQAIGLFQGYQFNLMQQMFRYVSEGSKKDAAMLLGLQGTFYGLAGLPAFQFINQHVIGNMSGNTNHIDAYDAAYGILGREAGDFFMYGVPSNILQANLYTRGDINPRQVTILPTTLADIPFVGAYAKFFGSVKGAVTKMAGGAPVWESFLQGLEHNGLSRPLSGIAQILQATGPQGLVYSTSNAGSILFSNDLFSWASGIRAAGGRPLDEAVANNAVFQVHSYQQENTARMTKLAETVKGATIAGNEPSENAVAGFAAAYAKAGGKQPQFNRWMMHQIKNANVPQSLQIQQQLSNPFASKMQVIMGGGFASSD